LLNNNPISKSKYIGTAIKNCEIISGGVNIIPNIKQRISTRPLKDFNFILVEIFNFIRAFTINGIWKAIPKPNDNVRTKLRKFEISVLTFIDSGPTVWKKLRTLGKTTRKQKLTPKKKRREPIIVLEKMTDLSLGYKPGDIKTRA
jgi:hypothetical protein